MKTKIIDITLTRVNSSSNGAPRFVCHFLNLINEEDRKKADLQSVNYPYSGCAAVELMYQMALKKAKVIGGRKFHNKSYGGGIVFESWNEPDLKKSIFETAKK